MKSVHWLLAALFIGGMAVPVTSPAAKADGKKAKLIAHYDKDGNGAIDGVEMAALRKDFAADQAGALKGYDKDGNGELSDEEVKAIVPGASATSVKTAKLIAKYDKNENGAIDGEERTALREDFAKSKKGALPAFDKDQDGKLSDEEILAIKPAVKKPAAKKAMDDKNLGPEKK